MKTSQTLSMVSINYPDFFKRDHWQAEEIGLKPDTVHSAYHLKFHDFKPAWFKRALKQFIYFQSATKTFGTCRSYLIGLKHFSLFLANYPNITADQINRACMVEFMAYLNKGHLSNVSKSIVLIHLRTFHLIVAQENYLSWPKYELIYQSDLPKIEKGQPRFIPEYVIEQLQRHLHHLPVNMQQLVVVLLETGRRISEVCMLPFDCMEQDPDGDYLLKVQETKLKKSYYIPISQVCVNAIKKQQALVKEGRYVNQTFLFPNKLQVRTPHMASRNINKRLNQLARDCHITDEQGTLWHFHAHQFRHTVGTRMINAGVSQMIVQKYLGHESPEMTARYAYIYHATMKKAFHEYQKSLVDIHGKLYHPSVNTDYHEAKWLRHHIMAQALPNGVCALPATQNRCPHANACLTCPQFRTGKSFIQQHREQLAATNRIIEHAKKNGWRRQLEMNQEVKKNLETIINTLEETST
jgi:integrase/recombinase XerD